MSYLTSILNKVKQIITIKAKRKVIEKHLFILSNSVVLTWLLKDVITFAIFDRSFTGRSLYIQLLLFFPFTLLSYLVITLIYNLFSKQHQKLFLDYAFTIYQLIIILISLITTYTNLDFWINELPGFFIFFLINFIALVILFFNTHHRPSKTVGNWIGKNHIWFFVFFLIVIFFEYPSTITFDSAHYVMLADLISIGEWASWDIIRNVAFPMLIYLSFFLFGYTQLALLLPMCIALLLLYIFSCKIAFLVLKPTLGIEKFLVNLTIFLILVLDATIFGYFHTLLTEYIAATIALLSCYMALKLYLSKPFSKTFYLYSSFFVLMIPLSWHIKQPYMGAALFPLTITIFLLLLRQFSWKNIALSIIILGISLSITLITNIAWDSFLDSQNNPMREDRHITTFAERQINRKIGQVQQAPLNMGKRQLDHYLENINFYIRNSSEDTRKPSLTQGFQNKLIAHRMFNNPGMTNIFYSFYDQYVYFLEETYAPPNWLNNLFLSRVTTSFFLFTTTYLLLPVALLILFINWFHRKAVFTTALLILGGTSFCNAVVHLFFHPIDRYLFMGYPLNLLILVILLFTGIRILITSSLINNEFSFLRKHFNFHNQNLS